KTHESGLIRGQLTSFIEPPIMHLSDSNFLITDDSTPTRINLYYSQGDRQSGTPLPINNGGQMTNAIGSNWSTSSPGGIWMLDILPETRAGGGTLSLQVSSSRCCPEVRWQSTPSIIAVAPKGKLNSIAVTTVDAAKFGNSVAPETIVAAFGNKLASQSIPAKSLPLPTQLDGTTVYVNGVAAGLFYVSAEQVNYVIPSSTRLGPADVVITAKDGTVSRGMVNVAVNAPAIFTGKGDGTGAPAGVASKDGQNFDILLSNPDGTPVPIDAGNYVALFGTGMRFSSTPMKITIGGVEIEPLFFGPQDSLEGVEQINLQIPQSLAG